MQVAAVKRKTDRAEISITVDRLPDVFGVPTINTLSTYFDARSKDKIVLLTDVPQMKACNSVTL